MRRKLSITVLILAIFLGLFIQYQFRAPKRNFSDYRVYYDTGKNILNGRDIYMRHSNEITPFKYSPFFAVLISPLSLVDQRTSASLFFILNLLFLSLIFWFCRKILFFKKLGFREEFLVLFITAVLSFRFILHCLSSGQVGLFILSLLLWGIFLVNKDKLFWGAFLIAGSIMIKYMPIIFVAYFFFRKKYKIVGLILASLLIYISIPALFLGLAKNVKYFMSWLPYIASTSLDGGSITDLENNSLWMLVSRLFYNLPPSVSIITVVGIFLGLFYLITFDRKFSGKNKMILDFRCSINYGLLFICCALFNPNAWQHNFVVLIFPYMLCVYYLFLSKFKDKIVTLLLITSFIFCSGFSESLVGESLHAASLYLFPIVIGSLAIFTALIKIKFWGLASIDKETVNG